jgi:Ferric reductase NAD binding domain
VSGPYGNCSVIPDMTNELVLVGGGVGVTPMISAFSDYLYKDLSVVDADVITSEPISKVCLMYLFSYTLTCIILGFAKEFLVYDALMTISV